MNRSDLDALAPPFVCAAAPAAGAAGGTSTGTSTSRKRLLGKPSIQSTSLFPTEFPNKQYPAGTGTDAGTAPRPASPPPKRRHGIGSAGKLPPARRTESPTPRGISAAGRACGERHPFAKWPDAVVAEARRLKATGMTGIDIAQRLGVPAATCWHWLNGTRRPEPVRVSVAPRWRRNIAAAATRRKVVP
jgi:hypothetical protein